MRAVAFATTDDGEALDLDGDGRIEIVVTADQLDGEDNRRRFGLLRGATGEAHSCSTGSRLPHDWNLPAGRAGACSVRRCVRPSPSRRHELLVFVNELAPAALGVLGVPSGTADLSLVATTTNSSVPVPAGRPRGASTRTHRSSPPTSTVTGFQRSWRCSAERNGLHPHSHRRPRGGFRRVQSSQVFESTDSSAAMLPRPS